MLACSFDEVETRITRRGSHTASFSNEPDTITIASAINNSIYGPEDKEGKPLGMSPPQLRDLIYTHRLLWAPDGNEAFDDGSRIIHLDVDSRVRLIGFLLEDQRRGDRYHPDPSTLRDQWLDADEFYDILLQWRDATLSEWLASLKIDAPTHRRRFSRTSRGTC